MDISKDSENTPFPSDFLSPAQKQGKDYALKWCEAVDGVGLYGESNGFYRGFSQNGSTNISNYALWRAYARGQQPIDKYKPVLGVKNRKNRKDPNAISYRVLNWEILDIASKYVDVLLGRLMKQNNDIGVQAVDKRAQDERRQKRLELQEYIINKDFLESISAQTGIPFESPVQSDVVPLPENLGEINLHMSMFYKEEYCLIIQDMLKIINEQDNYLGTMAEFGRDMIEVGAGATRAYRVGRKIRRRRCVPERMVMSSTMKPECDDVKYIGEYWDITIGQLKEIAGNQLTEAQYREIAEKAAGQTYDTVNVADYYRDHLCYPWDNTKITVLDLIWFSPDWETYQVKRNRYGNVNVFEKQHDWWQQLEKEGVTEESFNEANDSQVVRYSLDNQYQAMWIKGTKYVVNYGKSKDILRNESSLGRAIGPFTIYKLKKAPIAKIMSTLDNIQINWMQYQHHAARSVPAGHAIEFTALQDVSIEGAGGKKLSPKDVLKLYFETGILLWRRKDAHGNWTNFKPVEALAGGISNAMEKHFNEVIQNINLLRDQLGLNQTTDASTPHPEMGKALAEMASGATDDALRPLHFGFDYINLATHEKTVMHISGMAATGLAPDYTEALGLSDMAKLGLLSDLTHHELGVYMLRQPTEQMKVRLAQYLLEGTKPGGYLMPEEALEIEMEPNIYRAIALLKMYRQQKQRAAEASASRQSQENAENQIRSAQEATAAEAQKEQILSQSRINEAWEKAKADVWANKLKAADEAFLIQVKAKFDRQEALSVEEQRRMTELMKVNAQGQFQLMVAKENAKKQPQKVPGPSRVR